MKRGPVGENEFGQVTAVCLTVDPEIQQMTPRSSKDRNWQHALGIMTSIDGFSLGVLKTTALDNVIHHVVHDVGFG
jgi:hypothetical protein